MMIRLRRYQTLTKQQEKEEQEEQEVKPFRQIINNFNCCQTYLSKKNIATIANAVQVTILL